MSEEKMELSDEYSRIYNVLDSYMEMTIPKIPNCREILNYIHDLDFNGKLKPKLLDDINTLDNSCNQLYEECVFILDKVKICLEELHANIAYLQSKYEEYAELVKQYNYYLTLANEERRKRREQMYEK